MREITEEEKEALVTHFHKCFERPVAYWIPHIGYYEQMYKCSNCGNITNLQFRICIYCQAEMRMQ